VKIFVGNLNRQAIKVTGPTMGSLTLTVTVGTATNITTWTTASISYDSGNASGTASDIQSKLGALTNVGASNVACTFDSTNGWYVVTFAPSLGAPVMTGNSGTLTLALTTLLSGAAIVIPNLLGLRIFGEGSAVSDYDASTMNPNLLPSSRSAFMYHGTTNGILLHALGCNNLTLENIALWGATSASAVNKARIALLFSSNPNNSAGQQGGTGLTCRSVFLTRTASTPPAGTTFPPQSVGGCVQLGMNQNDPGGDQTSYQACMFTYGTNGLVSVNLKSVNHHLQGCALGNLGVALSMQLGGGLSADGLKAESDGTLPMTVLQIGAGPSSYSSYPYGRGPNANTFLLRNVRTDLTTPTGTNMKLVDTTYASPGTQVTVDGWDDTNSSTTDTATEAVTMAAGASVNLRHSLVTRTPLAAEAAANAPTSALTAALRLENLIVPEGTMAAALCPGLTVKTKVDHVAERTGTNNILRPDVSTIAGRPRYSPVNWMILQQKPKFFYDLGDVGVLAPNQGWNLLIGSATSPSDAQYVGSVIQNVQGMVADAIGGFNTNNAAGYVSLRNGGLSLGPLSGSSYWSMLAVVKRNAAPGSSVLRILSNLVSMTNGGLELSIDDSNSSKITFTTQSGSTAYTLRSATAWTSTTAPLYIMVWVYPVGSLIQIYINGNTSADAQTTYSGSAYTDNTVMPVIGAQPGTPPTATNLQIARVALFDSLVPTSVFHSIYQYGTAYQGR